MMAIEFHINDLLVSVAAAGEEPVTVCLRPDKINDRLASSAVIAVCVFRGKEYSGEREMEFYAATTKMRLHKMVIGALLDDYPVVVLLGFWQCRKKSLVEMFGGIVSIWSRRSGEFNRILIGIRPLQGAVVLNLVAWVCKRPPHE